MVDEGGGGSECPGCGITVAAGYPRCPKCQAAMPQARSMLAPAADRGVHAGGTSVGGGDSPTSWLLPIIGLVVVVVIAVFTLTRGGDEPAAEAPVPTKVSSPREVPELAAPQPVVVDEVERAADGADALRSDAVDAVARGLDRARLWSNVAGDGDALVISSAYCESENETMKQVVAANQAVIAAAGFAVVRCLERHGALVFEDRVSAPPAAPEEQDGAGE